MEIFQALNNYRRLLEKVDTRCREISKNYAGRIHCRKGCDVCCRHISVFPVEAAVMKLAFNTLSKDMAEHIRQKAYGASTEGLCPLLEDGACLLYDSRPIICRTHGFPMFIIQDGRQLVDACPLNFKDMSSFPGNALIDLEQLNQTLCTINRIFITDCFDYSLQERFSIAEVFIEKKPDHF